jgi:hypothetical protein
MAERYSTYRGDERMDGLDLIVSDFWHGYPRPVVCGVR